MEEEDEVVGRKMKLEEFQEKFHRRALEFRAVDSYMYSERFASAFRLASFVQRERLHEILKSANIVALKQWVKDRLAGPLEYRSYRNLRELAQRLNIRRWSRMSQEELLEALRKRPDAASL